jgi:hypothetical protein
MADSSITHYFHSGNLFIYFNKLFFDLVIVINSHGNALKNGILLQDLGKT